MAARTAEPIDMAATAHHTKRLLGQHHSHELLIVDVSLSILLPMDEDLDLLLRHLLPQSYEQVSQLDSRDPTVPLLVKVSETLLLDTACNIGRNCSKVTLPSALPCPDDWTSFFTSLSVGFCPRARRTSPTCFTGMRPSPFVSKRKKHSWKSASWSSVNPVFSGISTNWACDYVAGPLLP